QMARAYDLLGIIAVDREDYPRAREQLEQSVRLYRELGNEQGIGTALGNLGITLQPLGEWTQSEQLLQEALAIQRRCGDTMAGAVSGPVARTGRSGGAGRAGRRRLRRRLGRGAGAGPGGGGHFRPRKPICSGITPSV